MIHYFKEITDIDFTSFLLKDYFREMNLYVDLVFLGVRSWLDFRYTNQFCIMIVFACLDSKYMIQKIHDMTRIAIFWIGVYIKNYNMHVKNKVQDGNNFFFFISIHPNFPRSYNLVLHLIDMIQLSHCCTFLIITASNFCLQIF